MNNEKMKKMSLNLCCDKDNYMWAFRRNVDMYIQEKDITIKEVSEEADIPFETLKNFLYKDLSDCKLSTAVKLARAFQVSVDELIGAGTLNEITRKNVALCRNLPENELYLVRWYINYIDSLNKHNESGHRYVSVMELECNQHGNLKITTSYRHIDITEIDPERRGKVFFGITMPCDHYMPAYSPYDILLIANDRNPQYNENSLLRIDGCLYIARRKVENGVAKYYSIRDGKFRINEADVDEVVGYIAYVLSVNEHA